VNYVTVEVQGCNVRVPAPCACCLAAANGHIGITALHQGAVTNTYTTFDIPYCKPCMAHVAGHDRAWIIGAAVAAIVLGAAFWLQPMPFDRLPGATIGMACVVFTVITALVRAVSAKAFSGKGPKCSNEAGAVGVRSSGLMGGSFIFVCYNEEWGRGFKEMNE
jgi:hypothetical protein